MNPARRQAFLARVIHDLAAAQSAVLVALGDRLGLYQAMAGAGPLSADELARRTGHDPRAIAEWLANQVCSGYVDHDAATVSFTLPAEHAEVLCPAPGRPDLAASFRVAVALAAAEPRLAEAARRGGGLAAEAFPAELRDVAERATRARHEALLLSTWFAPGSALQQRLEAGARLVEVGCGGGSALLVLARAFPDAGLLGLDPDRGSIDQARRRAADEGLADRVRFELNPGAALVGRHDIVLSIDVLHELGEPGPVAKAVRGALAKDGLWLIVEPRGSEQLAQQIHPIGRLLSSTSALYCVPVGQAAGGRPAGVFLGEDGVRRIVEGAGFASLRRVAEDPFALVLEARP